jgi:TRAP-type mannitol/chloroaromatic compound transport system permease small subunit
MLDRLLVVSRWIDAVNDRVGRGVRWLLVVMVLLGAGNALLRYSGRWLRWDLSSNALIEAQWYLFGVVFLLGGAYTLRHRAHVRVDVLYERLSSRQRAWIDVLGHALFLLPFCALMLWVSWEPVIDAWRRGEVSPDPGGLPRYLIMTVVPLAFALLALQGLSELIKGWAALRREQGDAP